MPAYSGRFQYLDGGGTAVQQGACEVHFDRETLTVTPAAGTALALDLGDVDRCAAADWDLTLQLYTGKQIQLRQFGPAFGRMCGELLAAWRDRAVHCLMLEDLEEAARFQGAVNGEAAEIRIYGSNLAVLPQAGLAAQWRLAELESMDFDESRYVYTLVSGERRLAIGKLGPKTGEFGETLGATVQALRRHAAEILHQAFPFLDVDRLQRLVTLAPEGRSVKLAELAQIHTDLPEALVARAVDEPLQPYFDWLKQRAKADGLMTGFKFIRPDEAAAAAEAEEGDGGGGGDAGQQPLFFWFFFPLAGRDVAAWEATTGSGRATYLFRAGAPVEDAIARLTRGLALVNFRREPVYLPDTSLDREARYHRYAIGRRRIPELAELRGAFLGRAIHSSLEAWQGQVAQAAGIPG